MTMPPAIVYQARARGNLEITLCHDYPNNTRFSYTRHRDRFPSTKYSFKPVEEWLSEPVVRVADIRTKKIIEFPKTQNTDSEEISLPSLEDDVNRVVPIADYPETDTPTIWRSNPDATRYCQIPPIHDLETGVEIQRQMDEEGLTAQKVVSRAIAFSKVPLMLLEAFGAIGSKLVEGFSQVDFETPKNEAHLTESSVPTKIAVVTTPTVSVSKTFDTSVELSDIDIDELTDVMTQIKLQLRIPIETGMKDSIKRNWKGCTHFNNALAWCVDTAEWLERENKLDKERLFGMLINAMKSDKKPKGAASQQELLQNASAYSNSPVSEVQSYFELIEEALSSNDGDFSRMAIYKILPLCSDNMEFFGFAFAKRCFEIVSKNPKSMLLLMNSVENVIKRFGHDWGVVIAEDGQIVPA